MTEEENKAIENIKLIINISKENERPTAIIYVGDEEKLLNLIEKLQKENEELHKEINERVKLKIENEKIVDEEFIPKDKIREKIKEIKSNEEYNWCGTEWQESSVVALLEELLEEE